MKGREILTEAGGTTGLQHINHISGGGPGFDGIASAEGPLHRRSPAVVVDDERIPDSLLIINGIIDATADGVTVFVDEIPVLGYAEAD